ncbi:MAG TPA: hypothetical protein VFS27_07720 [Blastocatellia bacterium]|jgi:hypothetical protein|nr:hypothetical protein [Blastocatellia bacterium]
MANEDAIRNIVREIVRQALTELNSEAPPKNPRSPSAYYAPWTGAEYEAHPSRRQFDITEATVSAADLLEFVESKLCSIEKDKPCDHCGMCRNLGF